MTFVLLLVIIPLAIWPRSRVESADGGGEEEGGWGWGKDGGRVGGGGWGQKGVDVRGY